MLNVNENQRKGDTLYRMNGGLVVTPTGGAAIDVLSVVGRVVAKHCSCEKIVVALLQLGQRPSES